MQVAAITGGQKVPSARFRVRQFVTPLAAQGITLTELGHGHGDAYPPAAKWRRPGWAVARLASLVPEVLRSRRYDAVLLQREMLSSLATLERFSGRPRIFDVDDSIHLLRGGSFARRIAAGCDRVIAGNSYLAEWYSNWNPAVTVLPTAVDTDRYAPQPAPDGTGADHITIGWIGTSANFPYLQEIAPALERVLQERPQTRLVVMADRPPALPALDPARWRFAPWSEESEVAMLQGLDIGLMPLPDTPWTRGKCSFKMLQYMACGVPVVVSAVGMNTEVLAKGAAGYGVDGQSQWTEALLGLTDSAQLRRSAGAIGRSIVENHYSVRVIAPQLANVLRG